MPGDGSEKAYITERQLEILALRRSGLRQAEVASRLGITRQNVAILENRAMRNIRRAAATLELVTEKKIVARIMLVSGRHILDAAKEVLEKADASGIRLSENVVSIVSGIRSAEGDSIKNGILLEDIEGYILPDGRLSFRAANRD